MFRREYAPYVVGAMVLMTLQPLLTTASKVDGKYKYLQVGTTLLAELIKLAISLCLYATLPASARTHHLLRWREILRFMTPAAIYFVNNNLIFVILAHVNSTTYQILSSLKTVFTGLLFRLILKRTLTDLQITAIVLLACGTATSQIGTASCDHEASGATSSTIGVTAAVVTCVLSALGGVYSERLMKDDAVAHSIHLQNILLYFWGFVFNSLALFGKDFNAIVNHGLFHGYRGVVVLLILNNAFNGLAISAILKFTDNIVRVFAHAAAMLLTMVLEVTYFNASPTPQLIISGTVVSCSVYLYNRATPSPSQLQVGVSPPVSEPEEELVEERLLGEHKEQVARRQPLRS